MEPSSTALIRLRSPQPAPQPSRRQSDLERFWSAIPTARRPWYRIALVPVLAVLVCLGLAVLLAFAAPWALLGWRRG